MGDDPMRLGTLLKTVLMLLIVALAVVLTSWVTSEMIPARAQGGGGMAGGEWIMVSAQLGGGDGYIYMFNTQKEVLLVYAFYRRAGVTRGSNRFSGDLEFLAGRHCQWDMLYSQLVPYPYGVLRRRVPSDTHTPAQMKQLFEKESK
jgi:hypothetical protein